MSAPAGTSAPNPTRATLLPRPNGTPAARAAACSRVTRSGDPVTWIPSGTRFPLQAPATTVTASADTPCHDLALPPASAGRDRRAAFWLLGANRSAAASPLRHPFG